MLCIKQNTYNNQKVRKYELKNITKLQKLVMRISLVGWVCLFQIKTLNCGLFVGRFLREFLRS